MVGLKTREGECIFEFVTGENVQPTLSTQFLYTTFITIIHESQADE